MKHAIFHDYLEVMGGAERIVLVMAKELDADVITLNHHPKVLEDTRFSDVNVISLGETVKKPVFKQLDASRRFRTADFGKDYDFFIFSGSWAHYAARKHHPNLFYCHTPTRAFFDLYDETSRRQALWAKPFFTGWAKTHGRRERQNMKNVDAIVTNSKNTAERIRRFYGRSAEVVYTAVYLDDYRRGRAGDYWLSVNRLYPEKRIELQAEVFRRLGLNLKVVGGHGVGDDSCRYAKNLIRGAPDNIEFLGEVTEDELIGLYAGCRGLICTAEGEDLGLTPIEAMASGKPVVAVEEGGYAETVLEGVTGRLATPGIKGLVEAVRDVDGRPGDFSNACVEQAAHFGVEAYMKRLRGIIGEVAGVPT